MCGAFHFKFELKIWCIDSGYHNTCWIFLKYIEGGCVMLFMKNYHSNTTSIIKCGWSWTCFYQLSKMSSEMIYIFLDFHPLILDDFSFHLMIFGDILEPSYSTFPYIHKLWLSTLIYVAWLQLSMDVKMFYRLKNVEFHSKVPIQHSATIIDKLHILLIILFKKCYYFDF